MPLISQFLQHKQKCNLMDRAGIITWFW